MNVALVVSILTFVTVVNSYTPFSFLTEQCQMEKEEDNVSIERDCEEGYQMFAGHCYLFSSRKKDWNSAQDDCLSRGANLVTIETEEENMWITRRTSTTGFTWIGANDIVNERNFVWVSNNKPVVFNDWLDGIVPTSSIPDLNCAIIVSSNKKWNHFFCSQNQFYVCEK